MLFLRGFLIYLHVISDRWVVCWCHPCKLDTNEHQWSQCWSCGTRWRTREVLVRGSLWDTCGWLSRTLTRQGHKHFHMHKWPWHHYRHDSISYTSSNTVKDLRQTWPRDSWNVGPYAELNQLSWGRVRGGKLFLLGLENPQLRIFNCLPLSQLVELHTDTNV